MKPNFALSLSFEGIRLLHRVAGGWHLIGEVAVDDPKMSDSLAMLRKQAIQLDPNGLRTKLIIPEDQIKFTTIETAQTSLEDVRAALEGTTPYTLDELVIDFDRTGGRTYIAAVARETLDEAESFATEHKFAPVAFVAESEPFTFRSEVFFGATSSASDILGTQQPERDDEPIQIVGATILEEPELISDVPSPTDDKNDEPEVEDDTLEVELKEKGNSDSEAEDVEEDDIDITVTVDSSDDKQPDIDDEVKEPLFGTRRDTTITAPSAAPAVGSAIPEVAPAASGPEKTIVAPAAVRTTSDDKAGFASRRGDSSEEDTPAATVVAAGKTNGKPRFLGLMMTVGLLIFLLLVALWAGTLSDDGVAGWFGSEDRPETAIVEAPLTLEAEEPPRIEQSELSEIEPNTVVEPESQQGVADETEIAIAPLDEPEEEPEAPVETEVETATLPILRETVGRVLSPAEANRIYAATGVYQRAPRLPLTPRTNALEEFVAAAISPKPPILELVPLTDLALIAPDPDIVPPTNPPPAGVTYTRDLRGFILATPEGTLTPDGVIVFAGAPERKPAYRPGTEIPDVEIERPLTGGNAPLVLIAGRPPKTPPLRPEGLAPLPEAIANTAAANSNVLQQTDDLVVLTGSPVKQPPLRPSGFAELVVAPIAPPTVEEPIEEPTEAATSEIAEVEQTEAPEIQQETAFASDESLAGFRPALRPNGLVPEPPVDLLALADPALASFRAKQRPASVTAEASAPESQDINNVIAALADAAPDSPTVQAITVSARPDSRPRNFATVVAAARIAPQPSSVSAAPAIASGPIPGGVARAATVENAIRLRDINLIGVFGRGNDRRALVRLSNGRFVRVQVGSDLDGGKVTAIGDSALNYVKRGRTYALEIPSG